ncbi:hypothetical protein ACFWTE_18965 [Nocardiopsis sp. NPDC058631]|uniref:hypothetical protein n=1 Tax=Nocardiopsis sp. NPDC058631 TaxID=3346566 RepID=UPI00366A2865
MAITSAVTLAAAGLLTWVLFAAFASPSGLRPAYGLPADPCATLGDETLDGMDGELSSWYTSSYANGCTWTTSLAETEETSLYFSRHVPMGGADAERLEEIDDETVPRDADGLYRRIVDETGELGYDSEETHVADTEEKDLGFGDESVVVVTDIDYGYSDSVSQRVNLIVREGDLVSQFTFTLTSTDSGDIDADEAEALLADVAADAFG